MKHQSARYLSVLAITALLFLIAIAMLNRNSITAGVADTEIIFAGRAYSHDEKSGMFQYLSLFEPDIFVFGGDTVDYTGEVSTEKLTTMHDEASKISGEVEMIPGNHDKDAFRAVRNDGKSRDIYSVIKNNVNTIYVDTTQKLNHAESCGLTDAQRTSLIRLLDESDTKYTIIFMHHALWAHESYIAEAMPNTKTNCAGDYWATKIAPIIKDRVDLIVSGDGGKYTNFSVYKKDNIRYVLTGMSVNKEEYGADDGVLTFLRVEASSEDLKINKLIFADKEKINNAPLKNIKNYKVSVKNEELKNIYKIAPFYDIDYDWRKTTEPEDVNIKQPLEGKIEDNNQLSDITLSVRGNLGNHWETLKKSWDINYKDGDGRQIKLIKPSDRGYINQVFVKDLNTSLGVLTPEINVAHLFINDIDFGIYFQYEDFDKAFIELRSFNSNTKPSKNLFWDDFSIYNIMSNLNNTTGKRQNKTYQQNISRIEFTPENINYYFDKDYTARWIAAQTVTGDRHQTPEDNFRYFIDKATGEYILVTWDAWLTSIQADDVLPAFPIQKAFLGNESNYDMVRNIIYKVVADKDVYLTTLDDTGNRLINVFTNDVTREVPSGIITESKNKLEQIFSKNLEVLEGYFNE